MNSEKDKMFWTQKLIDDWMLEEKIKIENDELFIPEKKQKFKLSSAVFFLADVGDGDDKYNKIGRAMEVAALEEEGAEYYMDSVIIEDSAYQVEPGFCGVPILNESSDTESDHDMLAKFLLDNL